MLAQELVLINHAHVCPWATNFTETAGQYTMPEQRHLLQYRTLSPCHAQQPPALLIGRRIEVDVQRLETILQVIVCYLLVVEQAIHGATKAKGLVQCYLFRRCPKARMPQQVPGLHAARRRSLERSGQPSVLYQFLQRDTAKGCGNASSTQRGQACNGFTHELAARDWSGLRRRCWRHRSLRSFQRCGWIHL